VYTLVLYDSRYVTTEMRISAFRGTPVIMQEQIYTPRKSKNT